MRMPFTQSLGTLAVAVVLISHRQASARPTVHEVQIAASIRRAGSRPIRDRVF